MSTYSERTLLCMQNKINRLYKVFLTNMCFQYHDSLDLDGLPFEGEPVHYGDPIVCFVDDVTGTDRYNI